MGRAGFFLGMYQSVGLTRITVSALVPTRLLIKSLA